jgi:hypothetical protein
MKVSSDPGQDRHDADAARAGWYPCRGALGGYAWWTGREWGWPLSGPADRPGPPGPAAAQAGWPAAEEPGWLARHGWLLWLGVAYISTLGCAAACVILGTCLATGRPVDGATSVLRVVVMFANFLVCCEVAISGRTRARHLRRAGMPPPGARAARKARWPQFHEAWLAWFYGLTFLVYVGAFVGWLTHTGPGWGSQVSLATAVTCQCALMAAAGLDTAWSVRRRGRA